MINPKIEYTASGQAMVTRRTDPVGIRHEIYAWVKDVEGAEVTVHGIMEILESVEGRLPDFILEEVRRRGHVVAADARVAVARHYELFPVPRPEAGDDRPLLAWEVAVNFVCHDVKFGGSAQGVFAWPEEPVDTGLSRMIQVLLGDALAVRGDGPDFEPYTDTLDCTVRPSAELPTVYR